MPSVALVSTTEEVLNDEDVDTGVVIAALADAGVEASAEVWHHAGVDWRGFDLAVIRSPWDYPERHDEFVNWLRHLNSATTVLNPVPTIMWNLDKNYLVDLASLGINIVPTSICQTMQQVSAAQAAHGGLVVIKPTISAGSRNTGMFDSGSPEATALTAAIFAQGKQVIVQPAIESVALVGERSLVFFDGHFSHALTKAPILANGGGFIGDQYTETVGPARATPDELALAEETMSAVQRFTASKLGVQDPPLYGRIDVVAGPSGPLLLEAELFEPSFFLSTSDHAADMFVTAIQQRLQSTKGRPR